MKINQARWTQAAGWSPIQNATTKPHLILLFGATAALKTPGLIASLHQKNPRALLFGCSTAGEICGAEVSDDSVVATEVEFEKSGIHTTHINLFEAGGSLAAGVQLARKLPRTLDLAGKPQALAHVLVLSDGLNANGTALLEGMMSALPPGVAVTGGLAGDGARFAETLVVWDGEAVRDTVVAAGLYGESLRIGYGSYGGWDSFGVERKITKSVGNVLYEVDGRSALALYKKYLGDQAKDLPGSGLLFPLSLRLADETDSVVRTILAVNEADQSMTFAGDMPEGSYARLMKANFDRLIDGAGTAAQSSVADAPELALLISCVGRKLVLKQRVEEEVEAVRDVLGTDTVMTGFYSYGEISPFGAGGKCELHNQTMTVVHLSEK